MHLRFKRAALAATLPLISLALASAFATPAFADPYPDGLPGLEHSWRYDDGELRDAPDTDHNAPDPDDAVEALDLQPGKENFKVTKQGGTYVATFGGGTMTVTNAKAFGVDVSQHNGTIDWAKAKADGVDFAILRLGWGSYGEHGAQGLPSTDTEFLDNYAGAKAAGVKVGIYLYSYAGWTGLQSLSFWKDYARQEAEHVLTVLDQADIEPSDLAYPIYYDMEEVYLENATLHFANDTVSNKTFLTDISKIFCDRIEGAGYEAGIYSNLNWWNNFLTDPIFESWERWVARHPLTGVPNQTSLYKGTHGMWQAHSEAYVEGIGTCDIDFDYLDRKGSATPETPGETTKPETPENPGTEKPGTENPGSSEKPETPSNPAEKYPANSMVRLYNPYNGAHHFTMDKAEAQALEAQGWKYEGVAWTCATSGAPVYRLYNPYTGDHHFTTDPNERTTLYNVGWNDEGVAFHSRGKTAVYRLFNPALTQGTHHYVTSVNERDTLVGLGWIYETIGFEAV